MRILQICLYQAVVRVIANTIQEKIHKVVRLLNFYLLVAVAVIKLVSCLYKLPTDHPKVTKIRYFQKMTLFPFFLLFVKQKILFDTKLKTYLKITRPKD